MSNTYARIQIDFDTLLDIILAMNHYDVIELIKTVTNLMSDLNFTKELIDYFEEQNEILKEVLDDEIIT